MKKIESQNGRAMLILEKGEKLVETLTRVMPDLNLKGGTVAGLGALKNVEMGYYDLEERTYIRKTFSDDDYELIHLSGNFSLKENAPFLHVHAILGRRDFSTFGGHLFEAEVAVTAEVSLISLGEWPRREFDSEIGLYLICGL